MSGPEQENIVSEEEELELRAAAAAEVFEGEAPAPAADPEKAKAADNPDDNPEPNPEPGEDPPPGEGDEDPWAGVSPALRETIEKISGKVSSLDSYETRLKQTERRIGSIQNEFHAARKAADDENKSSKTKTAPTDKEMKDAAGDTEAWENLKEEYPVWAEAIEKKIAASSAEFSDKLPDFSGLKTDIDQIRQGQDRMMTKAEVEVRLVRFAHPDWEKTVKTREYKDWLKAQPQDIKVKCDSEEAEDAIFVLNQFKEFQSKKKTPEEIATARDKRLKQSETRDTSTRGKRPPKSETDMNETELRSSIANSVWGED